MPRQRQNHKNTIPTRFDRVRKGAMHCAPGMLGRLAGLRAFIVFILLALLLAGCDDTGDTNGAASITPGNPGAVGTPAPITITPGDGRNTGRGPAEIALVSYQGGTALPAQPGVQRDTATPSPTATQTPTPTPTPGGRLRPTETPPGFMPSPSPTPGLPAGMGGGGGDCSFYDNFIPRAGFSDNQARAYHILKRDDKQHLAVFDPANPAGAYLLPEHTFGVYRADLSPEGRWLITTDGVNTCGEGFETDIIRAQIRTGAQARLWDLNAPPGTGPVMSVPARLAYTNSGPTNWSWSPAEPVAMGIINGELARLEIRASAEVALQTAPLPSSIAVDDLMSVSRFRPFADWDHDGQIGWTRLGDAIILNQPRFEDEQDINILWVYDATTFEGFGRLELSQDQNTGLGDWLAAYNDLSDFKIFSDGVMTRYNLLTADETSFTYGCTGQFLRWQDPQAQTRFVTYDEGRVMLCDVGQREPAIVLDHTDLLPINMENEFGQGETFRIVDIHFATTHDEVITQAGPLGVFYWWALSNPTPELIAELPMQDPTTGNWDAPGEVHWLYDDSYLLATSSSSFLWTGQNGMDAYAWDLTQSFTPRVTDLRPILTGPLADRNYGILDARPVVLPTENRLLSLANFGRFAERENVQVVEMDFASGLVNIVDYLGDAPNIAPPLGVDFDPSDPYPRFECEGTLPPRLILGDRAEVVTFSPVNVRAAPALSADIELELTPGETTDVSAGPVCADGFVWWELSRDFASLGWAAQGDGIEYWLGPDTLTGIFDGDFSMVETLPRPVAYTPPPPRPASPNPVGVPPPALRPYTDPAGPFSFQYQASPETPNTEDGFFAVYYPAEDVWLSVNAFSGDEVGTLEDLITRLEERFTLLEGGVFATPIQVNGLMWQTLAYREPGGESNIAYNRETVALDPASGNIIYSIHAYGPVGTSRSVVNQIHDTALRTFQAGP